MLLAALLAAVLMAAVPPAPSASARSSEPAAVAAPHLLLLTLDTTRADALGIYGNAEARTPTLDAVAARGTRWSDAVSSSPLTLPSHASLLSGLAPPAHGARDNGTSVLTPGVPTLATVLAAEGYDTGAFVASRVLDRRFGLAAGFATYDDRMTAEEVGEYGYPERDAEAVTSRALDWLARRSAGRPFFLWVHYYDPHAPYSPPEPWRDATPEAGYAGEIAYVDSQIARLLAALPEDGRSTIVAAVGDHGESLGEHGERTHGLFLHGATLAVPLIVAGPGVPSGRVVEQTVASRRLAPTLLCLLGLTAEAPGLGVPLPGLPSTGADPSPRPIFSETRLPATAYGWSPLTAITDGSWRLIRGPGLELYDLAADPDETSNRVREEPEVAERLESELAALEGPRAESAPAAEPIDAGLAADLRALGYLTGGSPEGGSIDPKDGVKMLAELDEARQLLRAGHPGPAVAALRDLVRRSPDTIPFLTHLAGAERAAGQGEAALATLRRAVELNPRLEFLHLHLAEALLALGRTDDARDTLETVLELDPRSARAWLGLGEIALRSGRPDRERELLLSAVEAGTESAAIHARLGQIEMAGGRSAAAERHFATATELTPKWAMAWVLWGDHAERTGSGAEAAGRYRRAAELAPSSVSILLRLGRAELATGAVEEGRRHLRRVAELAPGSAEELEALRLLREP